MDGWRVIHPVGNFVPILGAVADLDGDGDLDVVAAVINRDTGLHQLVVFTTRGDRFLRSTQTLDLPIERGEGRDLHLRVWALWAGDLDRDGQMDLLIGVRALQGWEVWVLKGGEALAWAELVVVLTLSPELKPVGLVDLDQDGLPDLVVREEDKVYVRFGRDPDPYPHFLEEVTFPARLGEVLDVGVADVDGDGAKDLALLTRQGIEVWLQAEGQFVPGLVLERDLWAATLHLGDFSGDGVADALVGTGPHRWTVLCGDGSGGFHPEGSEHFLDEAAFKVVDLDGDGRSDLLTTAGYTLSAYFSRPRAESTVPLDAVALAGVGDLSGNGAVDIVAWDREGFYVHWNDGRGGLIRRELHQGRYSPLVVRIYGELVYVLNATPYFDWATRVARTEGEVVVLDRAGRILTRIEVGLDPMPGLCVEDFDGDGEPDVLVLRQNEVVVAWSGQEIRRYPWAAGKLSLAWCGDWGGVEEGCFVVSTAEYAEIHALVFSGRELKVVEPPFQLHGIPVALDAADFDGDGRVDPVALCWLPVMEDGVLRSTVVLGVGYSAHGLREWEVVRGDAPHPVTGLAVGDFNEDGWPDIAFTVGSGTGVHVLHNDGTGKFSEPVWQPVWAGPLFAADLDGNGVADLIASTTGLSPRLWILWNGGVP